MVKTRSHSHQTEAGLASGSGLIQPRSNTSSSTLKSDESPSFNYAAAMFAASDSGLHLDQSPPLTSNALELQASSSTLKSDESPSFNYAAAMFAASDSGLTSNALELQASSSTLKSDESPSFNFAAAMFAASDSGLTSNALELQASSSTLKSDESPSFNFAAAMFAASDSGLDLDQSSLVSDLRPSVNSFPLQPSRSALERMRRNDRDKKVQAEIDKLEKKHGMSIKDLRTSHDGEKIDLTVPSFAAAGEELGIGEHLVNSLLSTKGINQTAVLRGDCEAALGEQNGFDLSVASVLERHNRACYYGRDGTNAGYTWGSLGTTVNSQGKVVDAAISKATKNMYATGKTGLKKVHDEKGYHFASLLPSLVRDEMYGIKFIDANDRVLDHSGLSNGEFKRLTEHDARGIRIRDPENFDRFLLHAKRERNARKKKGNKKAKKAAIKRVRKITKDERKTFKNAMTKGTAIFQFDGDRFDEKGILDITTDGARSTRRTLAGYQFKIRNDDDRFEFE